MKKITEQEINEELGKIQPEAEMRDKEEFWEDFKARSELTSREKPSAIPIPFIPDWAKAAACLALICGVSAYFIVNDKPVIKTGNNISTVTDYEVLTQNEGVFLLSDEENSGTILWITDSGDNNPSNGDQT